MRAVVLIVCVLLLGSESQAAREREWQLSALGGVNFARSQVSSALGVGGTLTLRYGLEHWLNWEVTSVAYHYVPGFETPGVSMDLHRLEVLSSLLLQPPALWQVHMFGIVPAIGAGLGYRTDLATNRQAISPTGAGRGKLDNEWGYTPIVSAHAVLEWRFTGGFSLLGCAKLLRSFESTSAWDVSIAGLLSYSFYAH